MLRWSALCWLVAALPMTTQANTTFSIASSDCSGEMSLSSLNGATFACSGNLMLKDGFVFSDTAILIQAAGDLWLDNLTLRAPQMIFSASGNLTLGEHLKLSVITDPTLATIPAPPPRPDIQWNSVNVGTQPGGVINAGGAGSGNPPVQISTQGGNIQLNHGALSVASQSSHPAVSASAVPEAGTWAMLLAGLGLLAVRRMQRQSAA